MDNNDKPKQSGIILDIPVKKIRPFGNQPRKYFNSNTLGELADSIRESGQVTPGLVRKLNPPENGFEYELVEGERRFRACILIDKPTFRAEVDESLHNEDEQFKKSITANFSREGHTPVETANAIERLIRMGDSYEQIRKRMGKSYTWVTQHHSLLKLHPEVLILLEPTTPEEKRLPFTTAVLLTQAPQEEQLRYAKRITEEGLSMMKARVMITRNLGAGGHRKRKVYREYDSFALFIDRTLDQLEIYIDMPNQELREILKLGKLQERMKTINLLDKVIKAIPEIADPISRFIEEGGDKALRERIKTIEKLNNLKITFPALREKIERILIEREHVT